MFKRYASLYFIVGIDRDDNELLALTFIQMYVEALDQYFGKDDVDPLTRPGPDRSQNRIRKPRGG